MSRVANSLRGEAEVTIAGQRHILRPTFAALVAAEEELGSLFAMVDRAAEGQLRLTELATLFWHCLAEQGGLTREQLQDAVLDMELAACAKPLRAILHQILQGRK